MESGADYQKLPAKLSQDFIATFCNAKSLAALTFYLEGFVACSFLPRSAGIVDGIELALKRALTLKVPLHPLDNHTPEQEDVRLASCSKKFSPRG